MFNHYGRLGNAQNCRRGRCTRDDTSLQWRLADVDDRRDVRMWTNMCERTEGDSASLSYLCSCSCPCSCSPSIPSSELRPPSSSKAGPTW